MFQVSLSDVSPETFQCLTNFIPLTTKKILILDFQSKDRDLQLNTKVKHLVPSDLKYQHSIIDRGNYLLELHLHF